MGSQPPLSFGFCQRSSKLTGSAYLLPNGHYLKLEMLHTHPCLQCGFVGGTGKKLDMINPPQVLVLHISRFDSGLQKIDNFVKFPSELTTEHITSGNGQFLTYRLRGLIVHVGASIASGHYVGYVLIQGKWYKADDTKITEVTW